MDVSILHLSDLHIIAKNENYSAILGYLINDIKSQCSYSTNIILVITGDIIDRANYTSQNINVIIKFFYDLKDAIGDKVVGVEIVPGNHDKEQNDINKKFVEERRNSEDIADINIKDWDYYLVSYKQYLLLANNIRNIFNKNSVKLTNSYYVDFIDGKDFEIIFINLDTSWSAFGGDNDRRKLCIDKRQLKELKDEYQKAKRETSKNCITIMTAHHPLNWLREKDETYILPWLLNSEYFNIDFYLCGHTHDRRIKSFFDTYRSYTTLVTGIGWDEKKPDEDKNKHRYSIYNINIRGNSCEIIIRKTRTDGKFDADNDVLLTEEEKQDKRLYLPLNSFEVKPKIKIPIYQDGSIKNEYLFVNKDILADMKKISDVFYEVSNHMALFKSIHIRDFFVKYELNKNSKGTIAKQEIYDDYFYKNISNTKVDELFNNIKNHTIIYNNFVAFLRELCGTVVNELKYRFPDIQVARLHFRKYFKTEDNNILYIAFCQAILDNTSPPSIRDVEFEQSMIKISFDKNTSFVYIHNKSCNPLSMQNSPYDNFITMTSCKTQNIFSYRDNRQEFSYPFLTASLSVSCNKIPHLLDILNYLNIGDFIFKLVEDYIALFKINMEEFIKIIEEV